MLNLIKSADRHHSDLGWLSTYWHFSFADYHDPKNMNFGPLRVFNDDVVQPGMGFDMHPHRDMEIITYVLEGQLEHRDHMGNRGIVHPGEVQVMSAGRGIMHSEYNASKELPVHLMQLWIMPRQKNNTPRWEQKQFSVDQRAGKLLPVVSAGDVAGTLPIDQEATIYVSRLEAGQSVSHDLATGRRAYLFLMSGAVELNGVAVEAGDQCRIESEPNLRIKGTEPAELILLDLP